ncbi:hypothetical protein BMETH_245_0 [methanotrophic bacterial endosymbiont of Bathymodiolus sp.]|nr:hypothetical protein BMETH_245_0 [methanotrophic bacterial endosymbiont of Bathymodiolus sp.]
MDLDCINNPRFLINTKISFLYDLYALHGKTAINKIINNRN